MRDGVDARLVVFEAPDVTPQSASMVADRVIASHPSWEADREHVRELAVDKLRANYDPLAGH